MPLENQGIASQREVDYEGLGGTAIPVLLPIEAGLP
jgi:hypothetical protein